MASIAAAVRIMAGTIPFTPSHQYIGTVRANPATAPATFAFAILPIMRRPCSRASCPSCKLVSSRTTETRMETRPVTIATQRLPLKNASQSGSFAFLKRL